MSPLGGVVGIMVASFAARAATVSLTISRAVSLCCSSSCVTFLVDDRGVGAGGQLCRCEDGLDNRIQATLS